MARVEHGLIAELGSDDLVALAQCYALDATVFSRSSLPTRFGFVERGWIARLERGGRVAGVLAAEVEPTRLDITHLAVDPAHRRAGLGRALLHAALEWGTRARLRAVTLHVSVANTAALALYESEGFRRMILISGFYSGLDFPAGGDAYAMVRALPRRA